MQEPTEEFEGRRKRRKKRRRREVKPVTWLAVRQHLGP
jgi:hypothetical protein